MTGGRYIYAVRRIYIIYMPDMALIMYMNKYKIIALLTALCVLFAGCGKKDIGTASIENAPDDNYRNYYEVFVYSFCDSDGDSIGDLKGVESKLDYIADLGCNGIWLMPVMPSPTYHKYDVTDYKAIDPEYGSIEDFKSLIEKAHRKHINIIIDMVINHTSSKHPWFTQATDYLKGLSDTEEPDPTACKYINYYHFSKEKLDNTWYAIPGTDYYYEGSFWSEMPDLDLSNDSLRAELEDAADYWIGKGVDGFRMDAPLHYEETDTAFNTQTLKWLYDYCKGLDQDFYMVSEVWASEQIIEDYYASGTPSMFDFSFAQAEGDIIKAARGKEKAAKFTGKMLEYEEARKTVGPEYINAPFITNHDMPRVANALNGKMDDMKMAAALLLSMPGSPFIYYGEEIGMSSKGIKDENKRLPMMWSAPDTEGMCKGPGDADKDVAQKCEPVDSQIRDPNSLYNVYKKGLSIRNEIPEIARGTGEIAALPDAGDKDMAMVKRTWNDSSVYILYNFEKEDVKVDLKEYKIRATMSVDGAEASADTAPARSIVYMSK